MHFVTLQQAVYVCTIDNSLLGPENIFFYETTLVFVFYQEYIGSHGRETGSGHESLLRKPNKT